MNNSTSQAFPNDLNAIRQAQHEWRLAKRHEMEAKARKKQFKRTSLGSQSQQIQASHAIHPQPPHVHASAMYTTAGMPGSTPNVSQQHPVQIQPGVVLPHPDNVHSAQMAMHIHTPITAAHHAHQGHPQMHHTAIAPAPTLDSTAAATAAAIQLQQHLNANAKRTHLALEEGAVGDDPDAVAAARAAAVHAAASAAPGDAQFAQTLATAIARPRTSTNPSNTNRVEQLANEADQFAQNEAQRRALEQLEAQREWREAKRREIAAKKAKGAASKRGRKKARTTAPTQPVSAPVVLQPASSQPSAQQSMAAMHIGVSAGYVSSGTAQTVIENVQPSQVAEDQDHAAAMYDGVHNVQNVEHMLQQSVEDGGNVAQYATATAVISAPLQFSKTPLIANHFAHHTSAGIATVLAPASRRTGSFACPVTGVAHPKHDASVVTTELLAASTEAALNAVPDVSPNARGLEDSAKDIAVTPEQLAQKMATESTAQEGTDDKNETVNSARDVVTLAAGGDSTTREGTEGNDGAAEAAGDPHPSATVEEAPTNAGIRPETTVESAAEATEAGNEAKESKGEAEKDVSIEGGGASTKEDTVTQSTVQAATQAATEAAGEAEGEKESGKEGDDADETVAGIHQEGAVNTERDMVNLNHEGHGSVIGNEIQVPPDHDHEGHEGEMKDDPQEGLEVDGGDGGEDIMTAAAWQSLDSISHT